MAGKKELYLAANLAYLALYVVFRQLAVVRGKDTWRGRLKDTGELWNWEKQAAITAVAIVAWKAVNRRSWDNFLLQAVWYCKLIATLTVCILDIRLGIWYILVWWALTALASQPMPDITAKGHVKALTHRTLVDTMGQTGDTTSLVYCYTQHHADSITMAEAYEEVAAKFGADKVRFYCFDVSFWPGSAKDLKMSAATFSNQVPSVIMYRNGKEVQRIPTLEEAEDYLMKRAAFSQKDLIRRFDLDGKAQSQKGATQDKKSSKKTR